MHGSSSTSNPRPIVSACLVKRYLRGKSGHVQFVYFSGSHYQSSHLARLSLQITSTESFTLQSIVPNVPSISRFGRKIALGGSSRVRCLALDTSWGTAVSRRAFTGVTRNGKFHLRPGIFAQSRARGNREVEGVPNALPTEANGPLRKHSVSDSAESRNSRGECLGSPIDRSFCSKCWHGHFAFPPVSTFNRHSPDSRGR
jgi:hypothetical protein